MIRYQIQSPDGIEIDPAPYTSLKQARAALKTWCARFTTQGYYRTANWQKIDIIDLPDYCSLITLS